MSGGSVSGGVSVWGVSVQEESLSRRGLGPGRVSVREPSPVW